LTSIRTKTEHSSSEIKAIAPTKLRFNLPGTMWLSLRIQAQDAVARKVTFSQRRF